ncbi:uncharacterized protein LOC106760004 [Vigna radiata var. radiata]|uniref:Uncharacterized protein LOC106760004 n=1 Tax=Vigna radiata var. radiata TaxID=3916 RepID=A0A1S3TYU8_VIGRR|nr:uncharacterized protein LOC106760004 [Vigna radiata var. radiata]
MGRPDPSHALHIFLAVTDAAISAALIQEEPQFKLVYFVSRSLKDTEIRYQKLEKVALSLLYVARRLRPYFQGYQVIVRTDYPIAKILRKPDLAGRMIGWSVELSEFGLQYEPRGLVKEQHLAEFAVELQYTILTHAWKLYVDGSACKAGGGAGIVLVGPNDMVVEQSIIFKFKASNNQTKYEALIAGMELARDVGADSLACYTDSQVVEGHMNGNYQVKDDYLLRYFHRAKQLQTCFSEFTITHVPREQNTHADRLSKLAHGKEKGVLSSVIRQVLSEPTIGSYAISSHTDVDRQTCWKDEIIRLIRRQDEGHNLQADETKKISRYCLIGDDLYRRGYVTPIMKCLSMEEASYVLRELHHGICGRHTGGGH